MITSFALRKDIHSLPIYFSQVREDSLLDCFLLDFLEGPVRALMIASGGDTLSHLAVHPKVVQIDAVDANPAQLALSKIKLALLKFSPENRLRILGHQAMDSEIRWQIINEICRELGIDPLLFGPCSLVAEEGLDFAGRYEQLFKGIQDHLKDRGLDARALIAKPQLIEETYTEYFELNLLVKLFGEAATQNPSKPFSEHFYEQTSKFIKSSSQNLESPFLSQLLFGNFSAKPYEWMGLPALNQSDLCDVNFQQTMMLKHLMGSPDSSYDFIHLSNILDWLSEVEATLLLKNAFRVLREGGGLIIRQLNSSLEIEKLTQEIHWDAELSQELLEKDRSFFYKKVLVGRK